MASLAVVEAEVIQIIWHEDGTQEIIYNWVAKFVGHTGRGCYKQYVSVHGMRELFRALQVNRLPVEAEMDFLDIE